MPRPKALDLFCGAGGAAMGMYRAGFDVVGVDIRPQPRYPFPFVQGDALKPPFDLSKFDFIWASPPCQAHWAMKTMPNAKKHEDLIPVTRALLKAWNGKWIMENVPGAHLDNPVTLCGSMFGLETSSGDGELRRHRLFESNVFLLAGQCCHQASRRSVPVYGHAGGRSRRTVAVLSKSGGGYRDGQGRRVSFSTKDRLTSHLI